MKKLFMFATFLMMTTMAAFAQSSKETALDLVSGENTVECTTVDNVTDAEYWVYTAPEDMILVLEPVVQENTSFYVYVYDYASDQVITGATVKYPTYAYKLAAGDKVYIKGQGSTNGSEPWNMTIKATMFTGDAVSGLGHGATVDDPIEIVPDKLHWVDNSGYATYTATEDGMLSLKMSYCTVTVNDTKVDGISVDGLSVYKFAVEKGQTYIIYIKGYNPLLVQAELVIPEAGSIDKPFELAVGKNMVPAEAGDYWYVFTPELVGYINISSEEALANGRVRIFNSYNYAVSGAQKGVDDADYNMAAESPKGSFSLRYEITDLSKTYYIRVIKTEGTEAEQPFDVQQQEYQQGDTEDNPFAIDAFPAEIETPYASGNFYYTFDVPAGKVKYLDVNPLAAIENSMTYVTAYAVNDKYSGETQYMPCSLRMVVTGGESGEKYIIRWNSKESNSIRFTAALSDVQEGEDILKPLTATEGENIISGAGTAGDAVKYYTYTTSKPCKLLVTAVPADTENSIMEISFPKGVGKWDGNYKVENDGHAYMMKTSSNTSYYIKVSNVSDNDMFTIEEIDYQPGDSYEMPIEVEDGVYTLGQDVASELWLKYTVKDDDRMLTISSDIPYTSGCDILYGADNNGAEPKMSSIITYDANYNRMYKVSLYPKAGDVYYVRLKMNQAFEGKVIRFTEDDIPEGASASKAYEIQDGSSLALGTPSYNNPIWCKANLSAGATITLTATNGLFGSYYVGLDNAEAQANGVSLSITATDGIYTTTIEAEESGTYYFCWTSSWGDISLDVTIDDIPSDIRQANVSKVVSVADGMLQLDGDNMKIVVFTVSGTKIAERVVTGHDAIRLDNGVYLVAVNGKVSKVLVK